MWSDVEADFLMLGISDADYWDLPPSTTMKVAKLKREQLEYDAEDKLETARITALLTAIGVNNPKNFPKSLKKEEKFVKNGNNGDIDDISSSIISLKNKYKS